MQWVKDLNYRNFNEKQVCIDPLPAHIVLGQLQRFCWELLGFVPLITVSQVLSKLLWGQTKLLGKAI